MENNYSKELANRIKMFLDGDQWRYGFTEEGGYFRLDLSIKGRGINRLRYLIIVNGDSFNVYATSPVGADCNDKKMMETMAEYIARANNKLNNGGFQLDYRNGEIRFKAFVDCEDCEPSIAVIRNSIHYPAAVFESYSYGIAGIIFQDLTAEEAIRISEYAKVRSILQGKGLSEEEIDETIAKLRNRASGSATDKKAGATGGDG